MPSHLPVEDHGPARAAKALVGGGGDDVRVREGRGDHAGRHEAADVRHVGQQPRAGRVRDLLHAGVVDVARVRARSGHNELFFFFTSTTAAAAAVVAAGSQHSDSSSSSSGSSRHRTIATVKGAENTRDYNIEYNVFGIQVW